MNEHGGTIEDDGEYIKKVIEVGTKGSCSDDELYYFLPNLPSLGGSEGIFRSKLRFFSGYKLPDLIKGVHLIELKYKAFRGENADGFGFGSASPTHQLLKNLMKSDEQKAKELFEWVSSTGGNYYIEAVSENKLP